jgi:hypothetical protein
VRRDQLQPYDPGVELPRERPEHMNVVRMQGRSGRGGKRRAAKKSEKGDFAHS